MSVRLSIGSVGVGGIAGHPYQILSKEPDVDPTRLEPRSRDWGVPAYADLEALLPRMAAAVVFTPPAHPARRRSGLPRPGCTSPARSPSRSPSRMPARTAA